MKKFLLVLAIGAFVACNDSATSTENAIDSTADAVSDSLEVTGDSLSNKIDSTYEAKSDSVSAMADTLKK